MAENDTGEITSFALFVQRLAEGEIHHDLTDELPKIVAALNDARADGAKKPVAKLTLTIAFALDGATVDVVADYKTVLPRVKRDRTTLWTTARNRLSQSNPRQQQLPFKTVEGGDRDIKAI